MDPTIRLPPTVRTQLAAQASGESSVAEPRDAASVILVRDGATDPEFFFLKRHRGMAFAGGMAVFPGGGVDPADEAANLDWLGPSPRQWARTLDTTEAHARGIVIAAIRELFEETGVLLAGSKADVVETSDVPEWEADRRRVEAREVSFTEFLARRGLAVRTDLLTPWARWTTPPFEPRRYATWFFAAALPRGQVAGGSSSEAQSVEWSSARDAIAAADRRELLMLPPQYCQCLELFGYRSAADIVGTARELAHIEPTVAEDENGAYLVLPDALVSLGVEVGALMYPPAPTG